MTSFTFEKGKLYYSDITKMIYEFHSIHGELYYFINFSSYGRPDISYHSNKKFLASLTETSAGMVNKDRHRNKFDGEIFLVCNKKTEQEAGKVYALDKITNFFTFANYYDSANDAFNSGLYNENYSVIKVKIKAETVEVFKDEI